MFYRLYSLLKVQNSTGLIIYSFIHIRLLVQQLTKRNFAIEQK